MIDQVTGIILAGGRGNRMGGLDKGLVPFLNESMAIRAVNRLKPQVSNLAIIANRNINVYNNFGVPVLEDTVKGYQGPLAGMLTGLLYFKTRYLQVVPCDVPNFPMDLVSRLLDSAIQKNADLVMPVTVESNGRRQTHPVFLLMRNDVHNNLLQYMINGGRKIDEWAKNFDASEVEFSDNRAFFNVNTLDALKYLESQK